MPLLVPDAARLLAAASDLLATRRMAALELGSVPTRGDVVVYRVLGARQALQAVLTSSTGLRSLGAVVDLLHLASMVPVAALSSRWRRAALVQIGFAAALLVAEVRADG